MWTSQSFPCRCRSEHSSYFHQMTQLKKITQNWKSDTPSFHFKENYVVNECMININNACSNINNKAYLNMALAFYININVLSSPFYILLISGHAPFMKYSVRIFWRIKVAHLKLNELYFAAYISQLCHFLPHSSWHKFHFVDFPTPPTRNNKNNKNIVTKLFEASWKLQKTQLLFRKLSFDGSLQHGCPLAFLVVRALANCKEVLFSNIGSGLNFSSII